MKLARQGGAPGQVLTLEDRLASRLFPEMRRRLFDALAASSRKALSLEDGLVVVKIDLRGPR